MTMNRRHTLAGMAAAGLGLMWAPHALAQGASALGAIKQRGVLRVGVTQAPPWYSKDPRTGEWSSGLGVSMGKSMASALGVKFEAVEVTWGTAIAALQSNKIDIMYMLDATPERAQAVDFPKAPLLFYSMAVLARDDLAVTRWEDLNQASVRIAVPQASSMDRFLTENVGKATIQRFPGNSEAIAAFQAGRADAVCLFHPPLLAARQRLGRGKIVVPTPAQSQPSSAAVRREDNKDFLNFVDEALAAHYKSGQTQKWYEEFLVGFGLDPKASPPVMKEML
ncbi:MAG: transporter substrate-binding domain-containing protein [Hydrogenophaga sp.]|jgi:polar amino acid transport system substrate-binding protein|uniref:transporter substrate-binding domain-containing protein n=1 Tax=Hydrogenophaga sp. TaxID=1904254 RepID=UPI002613F5ED|nr:transporter substrate-binding domain-containing protein [Hydrogenophaga sp.]MCV0440934.1 transporter substrate-binding domain-containing protein [Hydrogenophaga sp.]